MEYTCVIINKPMNDKKVPSLIEEENQKMLREGYELRTTTIKDNNKIYLIYQREISD